MAQLIALDVARQLLLALRHPLDRDLAKQLRRAASSITLNIREGAERRGQDREHLWRVAAGSAAEVDEALHVALAWGYAPAEVLESSPSCGAWRRPSASRRPTNQNCGRARGRGRDQWS